jgi:hypothetical protein
LTLLLVAVVLDVRLRGLGRVVVRVRMMAMRSVTVMGGLLVVALLVMLRGRAVVLGGLLVVLGGLRVMLSSVLRHGSLLQSVRITARDGKRLRALRGGYVAEG